MMWNSLRYNINQALKQMWRNKAMGFTAILAITAMLLILGLFFVVSVNINLFTTMLQKDYDFVEVYLKDDVEKDGQEEIVSELARLEGVEDTKFRTKEDAMKIMKERWGESGYLLDTLGDNPLPNSVLVRVENNEYANQVTKAAKKIDGVEDVKYYKETVEKLTKTTRFMQVSAIIIMVFLITVCIIVVSNTIKLTVFARAKEISIMKYVGATNWFVRGPFLIEGVVLGIVSSLIAGGLTWAIYGEMEKLIGKDVMVILSSPMVPSGYIAGNLIVIFLALGISVGAAGSIVSMRRFLDK